MTFSGRTFRYDTTGRWYKGNTHIHSTASDGGRTVPEIVEMYSAAGYDFVFCTDHMVYPDITQVEQNPPLLLMDGMELDGDDETGAP